MSASTVIKRQVISFFLKLYKKNEKDDAKIYNLLTPTKKEDIVHKIEISFVFTQIYERKRQIYGNLLEFSQNEKTHERLLYSG